MKRAIVLGMAILSIELYRLSAQTNPVGTASPQPPPAISVADTNAIAIRDLTLRVEFLSKDVESTSHRVDTLLTFFAIGLTLILGIGTYTSVVSWARSEKRAKAEHAMLSQNHTLGLESHTAALKREASIFEESQKTLTLVNDTLGLAKEASARASRTLEMKLRKSVEDLEKDSRKFIEEANAYSDDRILVAQKDNISRIHSLGTKIKALANNIFILEDNVVRLAPHCLFICGLESHLHEDFEDAISNLEDAAGHKDATTQLKSLAYYWLGYIHNNINKFESAIRNFTQALEYASDHRKFELQRIRIESKFFFKMDGVDLVSEMKTLLSACNSTLSTNNSRTLRSVHTRIKNTLGNIYHEIGNETSDPQFYELAKKQFAEVLENGKQDSWVLFGLAEAQYKLGQKKEASEILRDKVMKEADREFVTREELRTKVRAKTTLLICAIRSEMESHVIKDFRDEVLSVLANVDSRLTIYSLLQRRNISKEDFYKEINTFAGTITESVGTVNVPTAAEETTPNKSS